jgi:hypothetical protein
MIDLKLVGFIIGFLIIIIIITWIIKSGAGE